MNYKEFFKDKRITQMGLGLLGRGLGDAIFLAECGVDLLVTDMKSENDLSQSFEKLKQFSNIKFKLGEHDLADFSERDMILKAAGIPIDSPFIAEARKNNIPVEMDASLFCKLAPEGLITIGVTGTRGKSTVTHLIAHILKGAGKSVLLGGNVRDTATLPMLKYAKAGDIAVLELDSWQLQGFGESKISPHVAVFTNLMDDHKNYYKDNPEQYFEDKSNIFKFQKEDDLLITGEGLKNLGSKSKKMVVSAKNVPKDWNIKLLGEHNLENIALAIEACWALKLNIEDIKKGVESFTGVEGRLQFVKEINGVEIYNDNNATTPQATVAALRAMHKNVILICGGSDKDLDLVGLKSEIVRVCKAVILLPGSGSDKLDIEAERVDSLDEAVTIALKRSEPEDVILFSPAFASKSQYNNEYERNDHFIRLINELS